MANIRDWNKYSETFWDWTPFNECFGATRIRIMDIDGAVERNGKFLFIETKLPGQDVPTGQGVFFTMLTKLPGVTVLVVWGQPNRPVEVQVWGKTGRMAASQAQLTDYIKRWFAWANQRNAR